MQRNWSPRPPDLFLVCGLGSFGQHCVVALQAFGVEVCAIDVTIPSVWELPEVPRLLSELHQGDFRATEVLQRLKLERYRAVLLVAGDEPTNLKASLTLRLLNRDVRLVVRSDHPNLNEVLAQQLGNFVAFSPKQLPAAAFALAALGEDILGTVTAHGQRFRVVQRRITPEDPWCDRRSLDQVEGRSRRILSYTPAHLGTTEPFAKDGSAEHSSMVNDEATGEFYRGWQEDWLRSGDQLIYVEALDPHAPLWPIHTHRLQTRSQSRRSAHAPVHDRDQPASSDAMPSPRLQALGQRQGLARRNPSTTDHLPQPSRFHRALWLSLIAVVGLLGVGTLLLRFVYQASWEVAFYSTAILLLGGYADLFGDLHEPIHLPGWLRLFAFTLTLSGTAFVGVLYALLTEQLLAARFRFAPRRVPLPDRNHIVIVGFGRVGQQVAQHLQTFGQPLIGITTKTAEEVGLLHVPLISGPLMDALSQAHLGTARSLLALSDDEMSNLEMGLMARRHQPQLRLVLRTFDRQFTQSLGRLFPETQALCAYALAAEAFAGAAFGENILGLLRWGDRTVLATEYTIEDTDTLVGLSISDVACGYDVVPILHVPVDTTHHLGVLSTSEVGQSWLAMPSDDTRLRVGDRLVVLATSAGLQRIERGDRAPQHWLVWIEAARNDTARFEGANAIVRSTACNLATAHALMEQLPTAIAIPAFPQQDEFWDGGPDLEQLQDGELAGDRPPLIPLLFYRSQAFRLVQTLNQLQIRATVHPAASGDDPSQYVY